MQAVPRQKNAQQYGEQLKQRFGHMKQVKRILRFATATNIATPTVSRIHQIVLGGEYFPGLNVDPGQETRSLVHMDRWRQLLHTCMIIVRIQCQQHCAASTLWAFVSHNVWYRYVCNTFYDNNIVLNTAYVLFGCCRHRHVPRVIMKTTARKTVINEGIKRRDANIRCAASRCIAYPLRVCFVWTLALF